MYSLLTFQCCCLLTPFCLHFITFSFFVFLFIAFLQLRDETIHSSTLSPSIDTLIHPASDSLVTASTISPLSSVSSTPSPIHPTLLMETSERGTNLSGGFAQSVALARIFLRKQAQIIILDEAMGQVYK